MVKVLMVVSFIATVYVRLVVAEDPATDRGELGRHNNEKGCWIQIERNLYDITAYLEEHQRKQNYDLRKWCGEDASTGWNDKDGSKKPHSRKAANLLQRYRIR